MGLGINIMEGREVKYIFFVNFIKNIQFNNRWSQVFRYEYILLFWLWENGCDEIVYKYILGVYIFKRCFIDEFCYCGLFKNVDVEKCNFCFDYLYQLVFDFVI